MSYKYRMRIEHGFRDIKTRFGFGHLVLKKPTKACVALLWLVVCFAYGLLFVSYEKAAAHWAKPWNVNRKIYAVITIIKKVITDTWTHAFLIEFLEERRCRGDTLLETY